MALMGSHSVCEVSLKVATENAQAHPGYCVLLQKDICAKVTATQAHACGLQVLPIHCCVNLSNLQQEA